MSDWRGCYDDGWHGLIVPDAFAHPAKYARGLIARIYQHCRDEGWLAPGDTVLDPFGGVGLGALDAQLAGLHWVGCELEAKFVALGQQNIELWQRRFGHVAGWGSARLLQGDSRRLAEVVSAAGLAVSSPPYASGDSASAQSMTVRTDKSAQWVKQNCGSACTEGYGTSPGQLADLPATERGFAAAVGSPPYAETVRDGGDGIDWGKATRGGHKPGMPRYATTAGAADGYGATPGQLGAMPPGQPPAACVSSPPYEGLGADTKGHGIVGARGTIGHGCKADSAEYGQTPGQLGQSADFWSASRVILEQVYAVLQPGGHAVWVCKDFVRKGKRVPFSDQWQALCASVGFTPVCRHRALLVTDNGEQRDAFGNHKALKRERKSFFRRLAERKGSPRIDAEDVICMVKA